MSKLISKESVLSALTSEDNNFKRIEDIVDEIPCADIMEHARALKEHCSETDCKVCRLKNICGTIGFSRPYDWDLSESECGKKMTCS